MPELRDHDVPKRDPSEMGGDPFHDALLSNPELREAYTRLEEEGYSTNEAHYLARKEVFGEDWEPDIPEYYEGIDRITYDSTKSKEDGSEATDEDGDTRNDDTGDEDGKDPGTETNATLADWGNDS